MTDSSTPRDLLGELDAALASTETDPLTALAGLLSRTTDHRRPVESTTMQGSRLGRYELHQLIGIGGMGATYRGVDDAGQEVAIKVVGAMSPEQHERFKSESDILRRLDHPSIARYRDHGVSSDGNGYLVMDYVAALTLQDVLEDAASDDASDPAALRLLDGITSPDVLTSPRYRRRILRIVAVIAEALASAHEAGVIHRDLKPANILLTAELDPFVIDFGLGRDLFRNVSLTRSGAVMGTLSYMAPEQLRGDDHAVDARADVYSLGLVLYRCLTGEDLRADASKVFQTSRAPFVLRQDVAAQLPRALQAVLYACLDPRPKKRYRGMAELAQDLRSYLGSESVTARYPGFVARCSRTHRGRLLLASPLLVAVPITVVALLLPKHYLWIDALNDGGVLRIDGDPQIWRTPIPRIELSPGPHVLVFEDADATIRREVFIDRHANRLTLMNPRFNRMGTITSWYDGPGVTWMRLHGGASHNEVWIDGRKIAPAPKWIQLRAGSHVLRARGPSGIEESQTIALAASEVHLAHLLYSTMDSVRGAFRFSMSNVFAPLPSYATLHLGDGAVRFLNGFPEPEARGDQIGKQSVITSLVPGETVEAVLRVEFPAVMRSVVFMQLSKVHEGAHLLVDYRTEGVPWRKIYHGEDPPPQGRFQAKVRRSGTRWFELRGRIRVAQEPHSYSTSKFLTAYLDRYDENDHCCFAIVADPDPNEAQAR